MSLGGSAEDHKAVAISSCVVGIRLARRMRKKAIQQGRSEVHGAKNNERPVCGRR